MAILQIDRLMEGWQIGKQDRRTAHFKMWQIERAAAILQCCSMCDCNYFCIVGQNYFISHGQANSAVKNLLTSQTQNNNNRKYIIQCKFIMQNYSYLRPPAKFIRNYKVAAHQQNTGQRLIYSGNELQLSSQQTEAVHRLREYLKHKNPTKEYETGLLLRYCYMGQFRTTDSLDKFKYYEEWNNMPNVSKDTERGILHSGVFYTYGKDGEYSPNIYFHPARIDLNNFSIQDYLVCLRTLLGLIEENMFYPGKIQSWNLIIDARDFNYKKFQQSYSIIVNNILKIQYSYPYRLKQIFLFVAGGYSGLWSKVGFTSNSPSLIEQAIRQLNLQSKCVHVTNFRQLDKYISVEERERQYGGLLDDLYQYWPISTTNKLMEVNSKFIEGSEDSLDYDSIINDADFFAQKEQKNTLCNFRQFCTIQ